MLLTQLRSFPTLSNKWSKRYTLQKAHSSGTVFPAKRTFLKGLFHFPTLILTHDKREMRHEALLPGFKPPNSASCTKLLFLCISYRFVCLLLVHRQWRKLIVILVADAKETKSKLFFFLSASCSCSILFLSSSSSHSLLACHRRVDFGTCFIVTPQA
jgi:hypothetical protein